MSSTGNCETRRADDHDETLAHCRLCAGGRGSVSLFGHNDQKVPYNEQAMMCAHVKIIRGDGLPEMVCCSCLRQLSASFLFRLQCERAQHKLQMLYKVQQAAFKVEVASDEDGDAEGACTGDEADSREGLRLSITRLNQDWQIKKEKEAHVEKENLDTKDVELTMDRCSKCCAGVKIESDILDETKNGTDACLCKGSPARKHGRKRMRRSSAIDNKEKDAILVIDKTEDLKTDILDLHNSDNGESAQKIGLRTRERQKKDVICKRCGGDFKSKGSLRSHTRQCEKNLILRNKARTRKDTERCVSVSVLEDVTAVKDELLLPVISEKIKQEYKTLDGSHPCKYCGQRYKSRLLLRQHKRERCKAKRTALLFPQRNYMCDQCGKTFKQRSVLIQHMHTHSLSKMYSCSICGKRFTRSAHVMVHMRIHNNIRPYVCETCGRPFTKSSDLLRHKRIHSEARDFPCPLCPRAFKRSGDVTSHMRSHTGDRPYKCEPCSKSYTNHSSLRKHKRTNCSMKKNTSGKSPHSPLPDPMLITGL